MERVTIFSTDNAAESFDDFEHDGCRYCFSAIGPDGPAGLIDGPLWIFLDWVMPEMSGLEMCRRLRANSRTAQAHITMVLDQDDAEDRRRALRAGADDYMVGRADRHAMLDRVMALHSLETPRLSAQVLELSDFRIDLGAEQAKWRGNTIQLRPNEFRLLRFMVENPNRVLSRQELIDGLGKKDEPMDLRTVDVWIKRLRFGLKNAGAGSLLRTVHAKGYVLDAS
ncbi:response regulator transcription factor [Altericroceibacterium endophyticum]|uniref:Response regulator n=1 Tax=Altericroceibacterium endophyticum TaxID=1808508 RepID=A0A6I4TAA1_9SPHN|nr:response regulator transcription factor [Altericroceibacterium endophyticum]MXO66800.1 response regulator [Altericroceibacterium endophyticum]